MTAFLFVYINCAFLVIISLPYLNKKLLQDKENIKEFFSIQKEGVPLNYDFIIDFLSNQALSSFFILIMIFTGKSIINNYGPIIGGVYVFLFFMFATVIAIISLLKLIYKLYNFNWKIYFALSLISTLFVIFLIEVSIRMG